MTDSRDPAPKPGLFGRLIRLKKLLLILSLAGLLATNLASLLHSGVHDFLYSGLRRMLLIAGEPVADALTRRSKAVDVDTKVKAETASLRDQKIKAEAAHTKANADLDVERVKTKRITAELDAFKLRGQANAKALKEVAATVRNRLAKGVARNTASIPAESIPYVGIGVVLSMTALDIHDACSTMKDINGLLRLLGQGEESPDFCGTKLPTRDEVATSLKTNWKSSMEQAREQARAVQTGVQFPEIRLPTLGEVKGVTCSLAAWAWC
jgi:hypothetical protein